MEDTIVGVATAAGEGGVAIVRVSGPEAVRLFEEAFRPKGAKPPYESHRLMVGHAMDETGPIDEAMGVVMYAPRSYTREDVCEFHTHGGAAQASQAEAVMGVISARSAAALRAGERQLEGGQSCFIRKAQEDLTALLSGLEAHIDYPDEIGEDEALSGLCEGLDKLIARLDGAIDERGARIVREGLRVALCGRPNAGKSTLFNALLGEDRAIVTDIPGTTRDVLEGAFMLDGTNVLLQDTAGLRDSGDAVERIGVERARAALGRADVALLVVDASQDPDDEALDLLRMEAPCPCAVLLNKEDAGERFTASQAERLTDKRPILRVSAREGEGLDAVREYLRGFLRNPEELAHTHERHMAVARQALDKLRDARAGLASGGLIDLAAVDLHEALYLLGRITGDSVDEQLLDDIFSRFCVGK